MNRTSKVVRLKGVDGEVAVRRDDDGVLHVEATTLNDALFGQGYCHAVDRSLQMLFLRILARGELSKRLDGSDKALAIDAYFRKLDLTRDVASEYARLSGRDRAAVDAYCAGVNSVLTNPWELTLLGDRMGNDPWTFADVVLTAKVIGYVGLAASQGEIERWIVDCARSGVSPELLEELFPGKLGGLDVDLLRSITIGQPLVPREVWELAAVPKASASNNWVLAGSKTVSGKPMVCNDPHLEVNRLPAVFFETALAWKGRDGEPRYALGGSVPGTPGMPTGRNGKFAWAITYAYMDAVDSWIEECRDGKRKVGDAWVPFRVRNETIERKGKPAEVRTYYDSDEHGTLEGDPNVEGRYLSTRWSNRDGTSAGSVAALVGALECDDVETGRATLGSLSNSAWCLVMGDAAGSIAYQMTGKMPIRREGVSGLLPLRGWDPADDWRGFADGTDLPRDRDPADGVLVTANDDLNHLGKVAPINLTLVPYRAERIRNVLAGPGPFSVDDMKRLQYDLRSLQAERYMERLRPILANHPDKPNAASLIAWDAVYRADSVTPALFEMFHRTLVATVFQAGLGASGVRLAEHLHAKTTLLCEYYAVFDRVLLADDSRWFGGATAAEIYDRALLASGALDATPKPWGEMSRVPVRHILLGGKLPAWLGFDRGEYVLAGGRATVSQGQVNHVMGYPSATGPSIRIISDLATDSIEVNIPGGPSDRRFSPWYASDLADWLGGVYKTLRALADGASNAGQTR